MIRIDEEFSAQSNPVQKPSCNKIGKTCGNQSSDKAESTSTISGEELPSQQTVFIDGLQCCTVNVDSPSEEKEDNISPTDEEKVNRKKAQEREAKLGLRRCYPIIWAGNLCLGQLQSEIEIKFITGDANVSRGVLSQGDIPDSTIYIRMKLSFDDVSQRHMRQKMQAKKEFCVLIALPIDNNGMQASIIENQFARYFREKRVVGVAEFPQDTTEKPKYKMLIFPPSDFVYTSLCNIAPKLADCLYKRVLYPHLLCLVNPICYCPECEEFKKIRAKAT